MALGFVRFGRGLWAVRFGSQAIYTCLLGQHKGKAWHMGASRNPEELLKARLLRKDKKDGQWDLGLRVWHWGLGFSRRTCQ